MLPERLETSRQDGSLNGFVVPEFHTRPAKVRQQSLLELTVLLVFFGVAEVADDRTRTERSRDYTYAILVSKPLVFPLKPSLLHFSLQRILRKPRQNHLQNSIPAHPSRVHTGRPVVIYWRSVVPLNFFTLVRRRRGKHL